MPARLEKRIQFGRWQLEQRPACFMLKAKNLANCAKTLQIASDVPAWAD